MLRLTRGAEPLFPWQTGPHRCYVPTCIHYSATPSRQQIALSTTMGGGLAGAGVTAMSSTDRVTAHVELAGNPLHHSITNHAWGLTHQWGMWTHLRMGLPGPSAPASSSASLSTQFLFVRSVCTHKPTPMTLPPSLCSPHSAPAQKGTDAVSPGISPVPTALPPNTASPQPPPLSCRSPASSHLRDVPITSVSASQT